MTDAELAELEALVRLQYPEEGLREFITRVIPEEPPPPHTRILTDLIERTRHERVFATVSWPPRHAKTVSLLRGVAWSLQTAPADLSAYVTYSDVKAREESAVCQRLALAGGNVTLRRGSRNLTAWRTMQGGGLIAAGRRGGITGRGISGLMIVDDPYSNREEADSEIVRRNVSEWFREVVFTRLQKASVIVVHTRWRDDDLIGELIDGGHPGWEHYNVPAIAEDNDILGRAPGEALWPSHFPIEELKRIQGMLTEYSFAALYQGRPRPRGTAVFGDPTYYDPRTFDIRGSTIYIGADPAASAKTKADHSVAVAIATKGHGDQRHGVVLDVLRGQWSVPEFVRRLTAFQTKWYSAKVAVEAVGGFKAVPQLLLEQDNRIRLHEVDVQGDKFQRSQWVAAAWNAGRLGVPTGAPWLADFLAEVGRFTGVNDKQDDQVDALAHAWNSAPGATTIPAPRRGALLDTSRWR